MKVGQEMYRCYPMNGSLWTEVWIVEKLTAHGAWITHASGSRRWCASHTRYVAPTLASAEAQMLRRMRAYWGHVERRVASRVKVCEAMGAGVPDWARAAATSGKFKMLLAGLAAEEEG